MCAYKLYKINVSFWVVVLDVGILNWDAFYHGIKQGTPLRNQRKVVLENNHVNSLVWLRYLWKFAESICSCFLLIWDNRTRILHAVRYNLIF